MKNAYATNASNELPQFLKFKAKSRHLAIFLLIQIFSYDQQTALHTITSTPTISKVKSLKDYTPPNFQVALGLINDQQQHY